MYKGFITENLREGLQPLQVAVKVHDGDNSYQGHREWLVRFILFICTVFGAELCWDILVIHCTVHP